MSCVIISEIKSECESRDKFFHTWNSEGASVSNGIDGTEYYTEFESDLAPEDVQDIIYNLREEGYGRMACGHSHDCCGCSFLMHWRVFYDTPRYSAITQANGKITRHFLIKEVWGINV